MKRKFITRENLRRLVVQLKKRCDEFIAPRKEHLSDIVFGDTKSDETGQLLEYHGNSVLSPRGFLLPQTEPLFEIESARECRLSPIEDKKKRVFYGVRPCDIKALMLMGRFFLDEPVDRPYQQKLNRSTFIALACTQRCSDRSFCYEIGSGPLAEDGFDLQLIPISEGFVVDVGSELGRRIVVRNRKLFSRALPPYEKEVREIVRSFKGGGRKISHKKVARRMREGRVSEAVWEDIGLRCVVCSGCITLCPTCSCFTLVDRLNDDRGIRLRSCDGCPYLGFTRMAGENLPELDHKFPIGRFFEHKLNLDQERYGIMSCVGCGRCIETCPGNISIRKFMEQLVVEQ